MQPHSDVPAIVEDGPWAILDTGPVCPPVPGVRCAIVARFATEEDAETFLATSATIDPDKVEAEQYEISEVGPA